MSFPFNAPLRLAVDAPHWVLCLLTAIAITATALVAGHQHTASDRAAASAAASKAPRDAAASPAVPAQRERSVSRSLSRAAPARTDRGGTARAEARTRAHRATRSAPSRGHRSKPRRPRTAQMPLAPSNASETVASARNSTFNVPGHCLQWSREQAGIPSKYGDAATAWRHATGRRPADRNPPRGAAVYWTGGSSGYGHIAISLGNGKVRSSDAGGTGQVATVPIRHLSSEWDLRYAGWANSINGYKIPGVAQA